MTEHRHNPPGDSLGALRGALDELARRGPSTVEMERRRLITVLRGSATHKKAPGPWVRVAQVAAAVVLVGAAAFFVWTGPGRHTQQVDPERPSFELFGLWQLSAADGPRTRNSFHVSSGAKVVLPDASTLWFGGGSEASVGGDSGAVFALTEGRLLARVEKRDSLTPFVVDAPDCRITVHGTLFSVTVGARDTVVRLYEGSVVAAMGDRDIPMVPGQQLRVRHNGVTLMSPIDEGGRSQDMFIGVDTLLVEGPRFPLLQLAPRGVSPSPDAEPEESSARRIEMPPVPPVPPVIGEPTKRDPGRNVDSRRLNPGPVAEPFRRPEGEEIVVETPDAVEEKLFVDAFEKVEAGQEEDGRLLLREYLVKYPDGRYWRHVSELLED